MDIVHPDKPTAPDVLSFYINRAYGFFIGDLDDIDSKYSYLKDRILKNISDELDKSFNYNKEKYDRNTQQSDVRQTEKMDNESV